jgi:tetratricopeptide (TPR) repeat protein
MDIASAGGKSLRMAAPAQQSYVLDAVEALKQLDKARAVSLLQKDLRHGPPTGDRWRSVSRLAAQIGEIDIAIEAARRFSRTEPVTLDRILQYCSELSQYGQTEEAREALNQLPVHLRAVPAVLHFQGTLAGEVGDFAEAERLFRVALARDGSEGQTWFALAMIKTFAIDDPDLASMEKLRPAMARAHPSVRARFLYGLAKALDDCGDQQRAFATYAEGAALRRADAPWDGPAVEKFVNDLIRDFTPEKMEKLLPSADDRRALFVNGLPRSGTTLVEQILVSHSQVAEGGEINLLRAALIPTGDYSMQGALNYQQRLSVLADPWGALAADYRRMLEMRFRTSGLVVDKTLGQSHFMGLLLHMLPQAQVIWMRRNPEDTALSCFRTFFTSKLAWSWSLQDIGHFFRLEDRLFKHWSTMFPDRILTVPYEDLAADPGKWVPRIAAHCKLEMEPTMLAPHQTKRGVRTASVQQVRRPINTARIGLSSRYSSQLEAFRAAYRG